MTALEANVRIARFRLALNDWFHTLGWCVVVAATVWTLAMVIDKLFALNLPLLWCAGGVMVVAGAVSVVWAWSRRASLVESATVLDAAAGLKERTSNGLFCMDQSDPFAKATQADAESLNARLSVRSFIKLAWPPSLSFAAVALVLAIGMTWMPIGPLQPKETVAAEDPFAATRVEVKKAERRLSDLRDKVEKNPELGELKSKLKALEDLPVERMDSPQAVRREVVKKMDAFTDDVRKQLANDQTKMRELKQMFRSLRKNQQPKSPTDRLSQALARGDFKSAKEAVKQLQEKLARMKSESDPDKLKQMKNKMNKLAKELDKAASQQKKKEQLQKELEKAGVDKETAKRALENLTKKDIQKIQDQMKKKGASDQDARQMARKCQACNKAGSQGSKMAQAAQQAAQAMRGENSAMSDASEALDEIADQLNSMESLDQQISEMESLLNDAQDMKNEMAKSCNQCQGKGCSACRGGNGEQGQGGQGRKPGKGRGGRAREDETATRWVKERTPVFTTKGSIISKMFVDGEQVKGEVATEAEDVLSAAEREATDAITKNKIPNQYNGPIKRYFSEIREDVVGEGATEDDKSDESGADGDDETP
jgi:hypothetical protein